MLLLCPSNPVVSIGPILSVPGVRDAVAARSGPVVGVSPIVGGAPLAGMADKLMPVAGLEVSALGAARAYRDLLSGWVIDERDADAASGHRRRARDRRRRHRHGDARRRRRRGGGDDRRRAGDVTIEIWPVEGLPEIRDGDDLAAMLAEPLRAMGAREGDVVAVTQKIVSKAEGRVVPDEGDGRSVWVTRETRRVVARRGDLIIAETHHGFVCANAGVDASNVEEGFVSLLPVDPDASAEAIRASLAQSVSGSRVWGWSSPTRSGVPGGTGW